MVEFPNKRPPNIVLIVVDDLGWRDLSCYRSAFHETPHLDALAMEGMRFTDAYATCPVCSPSRASLLTGKYPARLGLTDWIDFWGGTHPCRGRLIDAPYLKQLPLGEKTIATHLGDAGYRTWHVGKWHLGSRNYWPDRHGFQVNLAGCDNGMPPAGYFSPWKIPTLPDAPEGTYLTDHLTDEAIRLLRESSEKPFFLNLWHYAVHTPIHAPADLVEKYRDKAQRLGLNEIDPFEVGEEFPTEQKRGQRVTRRIIQSDPAYAAMVENLDSNIGRLRQAIADAGQARNTIIIFTSDNGGLSTAEGSPTSNRPLSEGKGWVYEGGTRVPLIVHWPGVTSEGALCRIPVTGTDIPATIFHAAGLGESSSHFPDGKSLRPLLDGGDTLPREAIFWHYPHYGNQGGSPASAVRSGDWKLLEFFEDNRIELYNLAQDPSEDRECHREHPDIAGRLHTILKEWRSDIEAQIPQPNPDYATLSHA